MTKEHGRKKVHGTVVPLHMLLSVYCIPGNSYVIFREHHRERGVNCHVTLASYQSSLLVLCIPRIGARREKKVVASLPMRLSSHIQGGLAGRKKN